MKIQEKSIQNGGIKYQVVSSEYKDIYILLLISYDLRLILHSELYILNSITMPIRRLPEYLINRLKAGEIVERPASLLKELLENSLDAGADEIIVTINDGGKNLISVQDNGSGIELSDMDLLFERYATSKIYSEQDLYNLHSYGFRGEALASIAEVSKTSVISKTAYAEIGTKLTKVAGQNTTRHQPVGFAHGTIVTVEDLFYNVPARLKFLKSAQTEFFYCYNYFVDVALYHHDKYFIFKKNEKIVFDLPPTDGLFDRIQDVFKKDRSSNLHTVEYQDDTITVQGYVSDSQLRFGSAEHIRLYVNSRPVQDKIIKKALMDVYHRQITPGEYPFAFLMIESTSGTVDVNVHPRKLEVKFADPGKMYDIIFQSVQKSLRDNRITTVDQPMNASPSWTGNFQQQSSGYTPTTSQSGGFDFAMQETVHLPQNFDHQETPEFWNQELGNYKIVGQARNMYIILQSDQGLFYIDQHALAERIAFEKMKKNIETKFHLEPELLLQPMTLEVQQIANIEDKIDQLNELGFDCALISENKIVIYAIPQIFVLYRVDIQTLFNHILYLPQISYDHILDKIFASKACKISIKAGDSLSYQEMQHLVQEWFTAISGMFVCQHGRPFFVKVEKKDIDKVFDR